MQVGHQDSDLQLDGSTGVEDEKSPKSHSSSPNPIHDDGLSSRLVSGDPVFSSVTFNAKKAVENEVRCIDSLPETCDNRGTSPLIDSLPEACDNGGTSPLIAALAAIDNCENTTGNAKYSLFTSKECCKQQETSFPLLYCNEDSKDPCCRQDSVSKLVDKEIEGKQGYQEGRCDSACSFQFHLCGRNSSDSSADIRCSQDDSLASHCSEVATESSPDGCRSETDAHLNALLSGGTAIDQNKIDCCTLPGNIFSVPPVANSETEIIKCDVSSEGMKVELCPVESTGVSQACKNVTGPAVTTANEENTTSPVETSSDFSQLIPRSLSALSEDASKCTSQSNIPPVSFAISALVPAGPYEVFSSQDVGPSLPSVGIYSSCSIRSAENFSFLKSQLNSSVSKTENFGSILPSFTSFRNTNDTSQNFEDETKFSSSCSLKNEQSTAIFISNESSYMLASKSSSAVEVPSFISISSDSCVPKITYKPSLTVIDSFSRESSPLSGFKFCTLGTPILSSAISQPLDARVNVDTTSSTLGFSIASGKSFKLGAACTGPVLATALSTVTCTNMGNTSVQTESANILTQSLVTSASNFISIGGVDFPATTTKSLLTLPHSSVVSTSLLQQVPAVSPATPAVSVTKVAGFQFSSPVSLSLTKGTETLKCSQHSSKLSRFRFQKSKPVKFTNQVDDNECHLISSSSWCFKNGTTSKEPSFGETSSQSPATSVDFKSGATSNGFIFGGTSSQSLATSDDFKSGATSNGFIFGGTASQALTTSSGFKSGTASNGFSFGGTSSQSLATSDDFKSGATSNGFIFGGTASQALTTSSDFKSGTASNGFSFGGTSSQALTTSSDFKSGTAYNGFSFGGTSSQSLATSDDFKSGATSNGFIFGGTASQSLTTSSDFKSGTTSNGFIFGGTSSQSPATSDNFRSGATSNGFIFGGTSSQSPATSGDFKSGATSYGFIFGGTSSQSPATSDFKSGATSNGFVFGGTSSKSLTTSSDFKSGIASNGFSFGGTSSQSPATSDDFKSGAASNGVILGGTSTQSLKASSDFNSGTTSNDFKSGVASSGVSCGGTLSQSSALSGNFKSGTTSNGFSFGGTSVQSPASSSATSNVFSFGGTSPQSPAVSSNFDIVTRTAGFCFGMPANSSDVCFNMSISHEKSQRFSHMQSRSSDSAQNKSWLCISAPPTQEKPFKAVLGTDTSVRDGCTRTVPVRHQHITAMRDYADLSFEELRLQYSTKYTCCSKQTESKPGMINREVQTTKSHPEDVSYMAGILNALECPVCLEIVTSPVLQCERGHHVCNDCWTQVTTCPLCKRPRSGARNYVAEAVLEKLLLPCKYHTDGCAEVMYQVDKAAHEKMCLFRTFTCLVDDCNQVYSVNEMVQHLKSSHCDLISGSCYCVPKGMQFTRTVCHFTFQSLVHAFFIPGWGLFYLCHKVFGRNTCLWMQMIGRGALNTDFLYSIEMSDKLRSVAYQGPVLLMHTITSEQPSECLVITDVTLATLKKSTGFGIKVSIWETNVDV